MAATTDDEGRGGEGAQTQYVQVRTPRTDIGTGVDVAVLKANDTKTSGSESGGDNDTKTSKEATDVGLPFSQLYRYATPMDKVLLALGITMAGINGALFPCMALVFGKAITAFGQVDKPVDRDAVNSAALDYFLIAIGLFLTDYIAYVMFAHTAERQMKALRDEALKHMLHMDISWYDSTDALQLSSRLTGDTIKIKDGMGQKLGESFKYMCQFFTGYIIGFSRGWDMSLVMACVTPVMTLSLGYLLKLMRSRAILSQKMYAQAGAVAEETLGSIRTVASLNGEKRAIDKY
ncbi:Multidrug resistance protein abc superfamily, partial [Globisporangium polare]